MNFSQIDFERAQVVDEAMTWLRTPFASRAQIKGAGVDCANLLVAAFASVERVTIPDYPSDWFLHSDRERLLEVVVPLCLKVDVPALADIALFHFGRAVSHGGIIVGLDPLTMIHAFRPSKGVRIDEIGPGSGLATRLAGFWRLHRWTDRD
jgi:cell wall-associated NlpC family hydrolase